MNLLELEWDHIFPYSLLRDNGYSKNNRVKYSYAQEITNRAVLTQTANRKKSNNMAEEYLSEVMLQFPNSLKLLSTSRSIMFPWLAPHFLKKPLKCLDTAK